MNPPRCSNHKCKAAPTMLRWTETFAGEPCLRAFCDVCGIGRTKKRFDKSAPSVWFRIEKLEVRE